MAESLSTFVRALGPYYNFGHLGDEFELFNIPFNYSMLLNETKSEQFQASASKITTTTYVAYNNRRQETIRFTRVTEDGVIKIFTLSFSVYLYDVLWNKLGKNSWELGLYRDLYSFEDFRVITGSITLEQKYDEDGNETYIIAPDQHIILFMYSPYTGAIDRREDYTLISDDIHHPEYSTDLYTLMQSIYRGFSGATNYLNLNSLFNLTCLEDVDSVYNEVTSDSHMVEDITWQNEIRYDDNGVSEEALFYQKSTFRVVATQIERIRRVSVLNTGSWSLYPLGSSAAECTSRLLRIPHNNINFTTTAPNAGTLQVLEAVEADVMYAFVSNPANAGINYADLRSMNQAVNSYVRVIASDICSNKGLPRSVIPYIAAKVEYYLFTYKTLPSDIETSLNTVIGYILQDYSINDTVGNARNYYEYSRDILSFFGTYYTTRGVNVEKLGVNQDNFTRIMQTYAEYQRLFLEVAYVRELNRLAVTAKSTGTIELLDKSKTVYPRLQNDVYLGLNSQKMICSDVTISISNRPSFSVSVNYMRRLLE